MTSLTPDFKAASFVSYLLLVSRLALADWVLEGHASHLAERGKCDAEEAGGRVGDLESDQPLHFRHTLMMGEGTLSPGEKKI